MLQHYRRILQDSEQRVRHYINIQILDKDSSFFGGFPKSDSLVEPKTAIYYLTTMTACYLNPDTCYYLNPDLKSRIELGMHFVRRFQRAGGFFDLINCNFLSGPDTAFCVKRLLPTYVYLRKAKDMLSISPELKKACLYLLPMYEEIILDSAEALCTSGFHTPNHRWAIASVLMMCAKIFEKMKYRIAAEKFLQEGIDCNKDGEYSERSAGNYNRINNDAMIMLAVATNNQDYYKPVIRNLEMMLTYIDPDDSIFTNNSTRWDLGKKIYPREYYLEYLYVGYVCKRPDFLSAANSIMEIVERRNLRSFDCLINIMLMPKLIKLEHTESIIPTDYHKFYEESGIVRCRRENWSYALLNNSPNFIFFNNGDFGLTIRIGVGFCEHRNFVPNTLLSNKDKYILHQTMTGWYYLPFSKRPETNDWWQMNHEAREKIYGPEMTFDLEVMETKNGIDIHIINSGIDRAPIRIEFAFESGCRVENEHFMLDGDQGQGLVVKDGTLVASKGLNAIQVGPCFAAHNYTAGKEGSMSRMEGCFTGYLTDYSPFDRTISVRAISSPY